MNLSEFLLARISEDEEAAREAAMDEGGRWIADGPTSLVASFGEMGDRMGAWSGLTELRRPSIADHIARHDPARVLDECEAKRQLVAACMRHVEDEVTSGAHLASVTLDLLALPYASHPDYDESWKP